MQKHYSNFPGGLLGIGLLILRTIAGISIALYGISHMYRMEGFKASHFLPVSDLILSVMLVFGSVFLLLGLLMPVALVVLVISELGIICLRLLTILYGADEQSGSLDFLLLFAGITIGLLFTGPGAFSLDARRYGRKRIFIPGAKKENAEE